MVIVGGAFLLAPGFITDVIGLALLLPPTRALMRGFMTRVARRRMTFTVFAPPRGGRADQPPGPGFGTPPPRRQGYDYEGTAREIDETELPPPSEDV